jgi:hypothetical protein
MGFITGLAGIKEELAKRPQGGNFEDRPKARYADIKKGGAPKKMVFLQEIDEGSPHYSKKNGTALFATMHSNPNNWKKSAACTADQGECYGCSNGWKTKVVLYVNVLVLDDDGEEPYVAIWNRGLGKGSVAQTLVDMAGDEDFDYSITDKTFKFSRTGTTKDDTTYSLSPMPKAHDLNVEDYELFNLQDYIFTVNPDKQEAYYLDGQEPASTAPAGSSKPVSASSVDADW